MADQKISELPVTSAPQDTDNLELERGALSNWKLSFSALRTWLAGFFAPAAAGLPAGGGIGQVATKQSATDYDVIWSDPAGGGGAVDSVFGRTGVVVAQVGDYTAAQVGAAPDSHVGAGGVQHPAFTSSVAGFVPASGGGTVNFLRADGTFAAPPGGAAGTYNQTTKDGGTPSNGRAILEFRDTGDATVTVTDDPGGDRTIISIDATAGVGGGGIQKGTPFAVGEITEISSAAGDGEIISTGFVVGDFALLAASNVFSDAVIVDGISDPTALIQVNNTPRNDDATFSAWGGGAEISLRATNAGVSVGQWHNLHQTQTGLQLERLAFATGVPEATDVLVIDGAGALTFSSPTGGAQGAGTLNTKGLFVDGASVALLTDLTPYLQSVEDDTAPILGGTLQTKGNDILITKSDDTVVGALDDTLTGNRAALYYTDAQGDYTVGDGAFIVSAGLSEIDGTSTKVDSLAHAVAGGRQVYVQTDGTLYGVNPPEPGWLATDTDATDTDLGTQGAGTGAWQILSGLTVNLGGDVAAGERIDYSYSLYAANKVANQDGLLEVGFGLNGADPASVAKTHSIAEAFSGVVAGSSFVSAPSPLTTADTFTVFARLRDGSNAQYGVDLTGTVEAHSMAVSVPGAVGGTGDVVGPASAVNGNIATFNGTTGKLIQDGGVSAASFETAGAVATHEAAGDPHPQYLTQAEGDARYLQTYKTRYPLNFNPIDVAVREYGPGFVEADASQTANLVLARFVTDTGTATFTVNVNGSPVADWTGLSASSTPNSDTPAAPISVNAGDRVSVDVTAVTGATVLTVGVAVELV